MSIRNVWRSLFICMFLIVIIACASSEDESASTDEAVEEKEATGGELRVGYSAQPDNLDVHASTAIVSAEVMGHVFETLLSTDSEYNIKPMLAKSYEQSDDGKEITFNLREGILFHNGKEMISEDVVASLNRWKDLPGGRGQFDEAVFEAEDDYTVVLHLEKPLSTAMNAISQGSSSFAAIMPKESIDNADEVGVQIDELIGTGPFQLVEWNQDQYIHLGKFDDYESLDEPADGLAGKKEALVDDIYFDIVTDSSTRVAGIQSGEYDIAHEVPYDSAEQLENASNVTNNVLPGAGTLIMFTNKKEGLFTNLEARDGLNTLIDVEEIMTAAFTDPDYYTLNHNMMMPHQETQWYSDVGKDKYNVNDLDKAKELFEEAGYDGEEIVLMTSRDYEYIYNASVIVQSQLESIGIDVRLEVYDWATLLDTRSNHPDKYNIMLSWIGYKPEPSSLHYFNPGVSGWTDSPELTELLEKFRDQPTLEDAEPVYEELQQWFYYDYISTTKIGDYKRIDATRDTVDNYQYSDRMILWNVTNDK